MAVTAIITGDIVNYTLLDPATAKILIRQLENISATEKIEFYRGDSFQVYMKKPVQALAQVFRLRAVARSIHPECDIRASIGIGEINSPLRALKTANSPAFVLSGRAFDELEREQRLLIKSNDPKADIAFNIIAYFADFISQRLTVKQAEVILQLLNEQTQIEVAKKLKKTQPTINQMAKSAGWPEIRKLIEEYEQVIVQFNIV